MEPGDYVSLPGICDTLKELELYGKLAGSMVAMIVGHKDGVTVEGKHMSVTDYLTNCSTFGFIMFFLFRKKRSKFMPAQHYRNCQDTVKNMFIYVALAKAHGINEFCFFSF